MGEAGRQSGSGPALQVRASGHAGQRLRPGRGAPQPAVSPRPPGLADFCQQGEGCPGRLLNTPRSTQKGRLLFNPFVPTDQPTFLPHRTACPPLPILTPHVPSRRPQTVQAERKAPLSQPWSLEFTPIVFSHTFCNSMFLLFCFSTSQEMAPRLLFAEIGK